MVAPNFSLQDPQYSRLLTVPDDDENEFLTLEELKPHHLTELGSHQLSYQSVAIDPQLNDSFHDSLNLDQGLSDQEYNVYYDLNAQQPKYDKKKVKIDQKCLSRNFSQWPVHHQPVCRRRFLTQHRNDCRQQLYGFKLFNGYFNREQPRKPLKSTDKGFAEKKIDLQVSCVPLFCEERSFSSDIRENIII